MKNLMEKMTNLTDQNMKNQEKFSRNFYIAMSNLVAREINRQQTQECATEIATMVQKVALLTKQKELLDNINLIHITDKKGAPLIMNEEVFKKIFKKVSKDGSAILFKNNTFTIHCKDGDITATKMPLTTMVELLPKTNEEQKQHLETTVATAPSPKRMKP